MSIISLVRGDDAVRRITVTLADEPVGLTSAQAITFTAKSRLSDSDDDAVLRKTLDDGIAVDGDEDNVAVITFDAADTADLVVPGRRTYLYDIEIIDADGLTRTVTEGYLEILADVTRDATPES